MNIVDLDYFVENNTKLAGRIRIAPEERSLAPAPGFMFGPVPDHIFHTLFSGLTAGALGCYILNGCRLGYDAILFREQTALYSSNLNHGSDFVESYLSQQKAVNRKIPVRRIRGQAACIHGPGHWTYGHWLVDFMPRLSLLTWAGYDLRRLKFVLPYTVPPFVIDMLSLTGISVSQLIPYDPDNEQVEFDELVIPTYLRTGNRLHSHFMRATQEWLSRFVPERHEHRPSRRLFISRAQYPSERSCENRDQIEYLAQAAGFEIICPETFRLERQITLFREARQVIGEYGSGLHNSIFGGQSLHCLALRGTSHFLGFIQSDLAHAMGQSTSYVFGYADMNAKTYRFYIDPDNFRRALECLEVELENNS